MRFSFHKSGDGGIRLRKMSQRRQYSIKWAWCKATFGKIKYLTVKMLSVKMKYVN